MDIVCLGFAREQFPEKIEVACFMPAICYYYFYLMHVIHEDIKGANKDTKVLMLEGLLPCTIFFFVLRSCTMHELHNQNISIG